MSFSDYQVHEFVLVKDTPHQITAVEGDSIQATPFCFPSDVMISPQFENEVLITSDSTTFHVNEIQAKCLVLHTKDYVKFYCPDFNSSNTFVCDQRHVFSLTQEFIYLQNNYSD